MRAIFTGLLILAALVWIVVRWWPSVSRSVLVRGVYHHLPPVESSPVVALVNNILVDAVEQGASEIRIGPTGPDGEEEVSYMVDGEKRSVAIPPAVLAAHVVRRVKILAGVDPLPTKGVEESRFRLRMLRREVEITAEFREAKPVDEVRLSIALEDRA